MSTPKPTMHRPVPMNTHVVIPALFLGKEVTGTVVGIASVHVIYQYIVQLDRPHQDPDLGEIRVILVDGCQLLDAEGQPAWRFKNPEDRMAYLKEIGNV